MEENFFSGRKNCCFTGHRPDSLPMKGSAEEVQLKLALIAAVTSAAEAGVTSFLNGGAQGFDLLAGEAVLAVKENGHPSLSLSLFLPSPHHADGWPAVDSVRFHSLYENAAFIDYAADRNYPYAYLSRNRKLVEHADCCICYLKKMSGGTLYTVNYAFDKGIPVMNLYKGPVRD